MPNKDIKKRRKTRNEWYKNNRDSEIAHVQRRKKELSRWFEEYKDKLYCLDCGESHNACLTFHHKNPENKFKTVSWLVCNGYSKKRIIEEINKCKLLCHNCHAKIHYRVKRNN